MDNNSKNEIEEILEDLNKEIIEENTEQEKIEETFKTEEISSKPEGECWALVCYTEKTFFQKIIYSIKKLAILTKERILRKA